MKKFLFMTIFATAMIAFVACSPKSDSSTSGSSSASIKNSGETIDEMNSGSTTANDPGTTIENSGAAIDESKATAQKPGITGDPEKDAEAMCQYLYNEAKKVKTTEEAKKWTELEHELASNLEKAYRNDPEKWKIADDIQEKYDRGVVRQEVERVLNLIGETLDMSSKIVE